MRISPTRSRRRQSPPIHSAFVLCLLFALFALFCGNSPAQVSLSGAVSSSGPQRTATASAPRWTDAPLIAFWGDSTMSGFPGWTNYTDISGTPGGNPNYNVAYRTWLDSDKRITGTNFGSAGATFATAFTREISYITNCHAQWAVGRCGVNNINNGDVWTNAVTNLDNFATAICAQAGMELVICEILPAAAGVNATNILIWNTNITTWVATNAQSAHCHLLLDHDLFGDPATGYYTSAPGYTSDTTHPNTTGVEVLAQNFVTRLRTLLAY